MPFNIGDTVCLDYNNNTRIGEIIEKQNPSWYKVKVLEVTDPYLKQLPREYIKIHKNALKLLSDMTTQEARRVMLEMGYTYE